MRNAVLLAHAPLFWTSVASAASVQGADESTSLGSRASQILIKPSPPAVTRRRPFGSSAKPSTASLWPLSVKIFAYVLNQSDQPKQVVVRVEGDAGGADSQPLDVAPGKLVRVPFDGKAPPPDKRAALPELTGPLQFALFEVVNMKNVLLDKKSLG